MQVYRCRWTGAAGGREDQGSEPKRQQYGMQVESEWGTDER